jgi:hypothetical protein
MDQVLDTAKQDGNRIEWVLETHTHAIHWSPLVQYAG